jgi:hypothetical protein
MTEEDVNNLGVPRAKSKPLQHPEIVKLFWELYEDTGDAGKLETFVAAVRAVERAHGINKTERGDFICVKRDKLQQAIEALELAKLNGKSGLYSGEIHQITESADELRGELNKSDCSAEREDAGSVHLIFMNDSVQLAVIGDRLRAHEKLEVMKDEYWQKNTWAFCRSKEAYDGICHWRVETVKIG